MIQHNAAVLSLVLVLIVVALALLIIGRARSKDDHGYARVYRVRRYYATAIIVALGGLLFFTLGRTPYSRSAVQTPDLKVDATGWMWAWDFQVDGKSAVPLVVPAQKLVEFAVTSKDVNHGFGIYDPDGHLIAQTQAMPGYVNHLRVRFNRPGLYHVLCLEYCGVAHPVMMGVISAQ